MGSSCRYALSPHLELSLNGSQPLLLGSNARDDNTLLAVDLTNPDYYDGAGAQIVLQKDIVHIARTMFLWNGSAYQRFAVRNHGDRPLVLQIVLHFDSDFADLFEVRGLQRPRRGTVSRSVTGPDQALLSYLGLDNVTRRTLLTFHPAPSEISPTKVSYRLVLAPGESKPIFLAVTCNAEPVYRPACFRADCWRRIASCAHNRAGSPRSRPRASCSTKSSAARPPTSRCW